MHKETNNIVKTFKLIALLSQKPFLKVKELGVRLGLSDKAIYRWLDALREVGYDIQSNELHQYFISNSKIPSRELFSEEETSLLKSTLVSVPDKDIRKRSIIQKINQIMHQHPDPDALAEYQVMKNVETLKDAINSDKQVKIHNYHNPNKNTVSNRVLDPISLTQNDSILIAYDHEKCEIRNFKVLRCGIVELLDQKRTVVTHEWRTDIFNFSGTKSKPVIVEMDSTAFKILVEEFPEVKTYVEKKHDNRYRFCYEVMDLRGIARFLLGLADHIYLVEPKELVDEMKRRIQECKPLES